MCFRNVCFVHVQKLAQIQRGFVGGCVGRRGGGGWSCNSKFHFHGKLWINLDTIFTPPTLYFILLFNKSIVLPVNVCEISCQ